MTTRNPKDAPEVLPAVPDALRGLPILATDEDIVQRSLERILSAETAEEALKSPEAAGVRDLAGRTVLLVRVTGIAQSSIREGEWYVVMEAIRQDTGEYVTLTSGAQFVVAAAVKMHKAGWLPRLVRIVELESASNPGQSSLWLVDAEPKERPPRTAAENVAEARRRQASAADTGPTVPESDEGPAF